MQFYDFRQNYNKDLKFHIRLNQLCMKLLNLDEYLSYNRTDVKRLILQANKDEFKLRKYLCNNGFYINNQKIIKEDNKFYEIDVFEKGKEDYTFEELYFGKILMEEKNDIFIEKWKLKYQKYQNYQKHKKTDMDNKIIEYMEKIICK